MDAEELSKRMDRAWKTATVSRSATLLLIAVATAFGTWLITSHNWILATFVYAMSLLWTIEVFTTKVQFINKMQS